MLYNKPLKTFAALTVLLIAGIAANAQDAARLHFEKLNSLETKARDVVEVNVDGKLLDLELDGRVARLPGGLFQQRQQL